MGKILISYALLERLELNVANAERIISGTLMNF
jgi:hypothetical protein